MSLAISNLRHEDGYWQATVSKDGHSIDVDCKHGSWQTTVEYDPADTATVRIRHEVSRLVAQELQAKVLFLERKARKAAA